MLEVVQMRKFILPLFNSALPSVLNNHFCWDHGHLYHSPALSHGPGRSADIHDDGEG